ncbi:MAG: protein kinase, partial [Planctomycetes bacterium]|nr:protein kinase [Planctomycetota bacterium]
MTEQSLPEESIFLQALEISSLADRVAFLDRACGDNRQLRAEVEGLLRSHQNTGDFFDLPGEPAFGKASHPPSAERIVAEGVGSQIGPYKLLEQIGEGGMGTVYMAEQIHPVHRKVALKLIKAGLDSRQVIARFEAERQALALMDHPHIARVLDAGTTGAGQPYFVMELVHGVTITKYCDQHRLSPRQRLELFVPVCQAIQHAHQKGIIHRDIKSSNVLIARYDGRPVPKVIDFGVAKAVGQKLTDATLFTEFGAIVGTLEYMSPEQAEQNQLDIDTRSDIYSLGVLLYELLTGTTPLDKKRLRGAAILELLRIIKEEEPPKPSTRLSATEELPSIAANRSLEPNKLSGLMRGELDWIVMKALEKDRNRRYETANGFAMDIQRYLADEPVLACPPSVGYRLTKFARRNKGALSAAGLVAIALFVGTGVSIWQAIRATRAEGLAQTRLEAETKARSEAVNARNEAEAGREREKTLKDEAVQEKQRAEANFDKARRAVDEYLTQVTDNQLLSVPGLQPLRENLLSAALKFYAEFTQERADDPTLQRELASAHFRLARIHQELGQTGPSAGSNTEAIRLYERLRDAGHFDQDAQLALAKAYYYATRYEDTVKLCQIVLRAEPEHAEARSLLAETYNSLAVSAGNNPKSIDAALDYHRQAFELRQALVHDFNENASYVAQLGGTLNNLGVLLDKQGKSEEAAAMFERGVEYSVQAYEKAPHSILWGRWLCNGLRNLAQTHAALDHNRDALAAYQRLVVVSRKLVFENPAVTSLRGELCKAHLVLARHQRQMGDSAEALRTFRDARDVLEHIPHETAQQLYELATVYAELAQPATGQVAPDEDEAADRLRHLELALQTLHKAADVGFIDAKALKANRVFDALRERLDFQQLVSTIDKAAQAQQLAARKEGSAQQKLADRMKAAQLLSDILNEQPGAMGHRRTLAATHHSIAMIQIGLKQFDEAERSLQQALGLRDALRQAQPGKPELEVDWIGEHVSLGNLYWQTGRFPEAHRIWQECSPKLLAIADAHRDRVALQKQIGGLERLMGDAYANYGLWPLVREYAVRNSRFHRITRNAKDAEYAPLLLTGADPQVVNEYLTLLGEQLKGAEAAEDWHITHLVRVAAISQSPALSADDLVSRSRKLLADQKGGAWFAAALATTLYRAGAFSEAQEILRAHDVVRALGTSQFADSHPFSFRQKPFLDALVAAAVGDQQEAQAGFARAEALYQELGLLIVTRPANGSAGLPQPHPHELAYLQALRREAWLRVKGAAAPDDAWQHLIQARGYRLIGEIEQADREMAAAATAAPDDPQVWLGQARLQAQWSDWAGSAEKAWSRAVELAGGDPRPWIDRGRWHAERGKTELAEADLGKAASLTPDELNKFLEAGWWVAGPYPQELKEFCPPEMDPDPSRPIPIVDPKTGLSVEPVKWRSCLSGRQGRVDLSSLQIRSENAAVYALAHVFAPAEQTKLLLVPKTQPIRVWINGVLVEDFVPGEYPTQPWYDSALRIPIALRAGRNTFLVKVRTPDFTLRIGDTPRDRALFLAEQDRFVEA